MPPVEKMPGLKGFSYGRPRGRTARRHVLLGLQRTFESAGAVGAALGSPEGQATVAAIPNYSLASPTILVVETTDG